MLIDQICDGQHAVDRRFERAGQFRHDHFGRTAVVPEDREGRVLARQLHDVAEFDDRATTGQQRWRAPASIASSE